MILQCGTIAWAIVLDPNGRHPKRRPIVIVTSQSDMDSHEEILAVAITTQIPEPLPADAIELPWQHNGHPRTKLARPCIARCDWIVSLTKSDILQIGGVVPEPLLREILIRVVLPPN